MTDSVNFFLFYSFIQQIVAEYFCTPDTAMAAGIDSPRTCFLLSQSSQLSGLKQAITILCVEYFMFFLGLVFLKAIGLKKKSIVHRIVDDRKMLMKKKWSFVCVISPLVK